MKFSSASEAIDALRAILDDSGAETSQDDLSALLAVTARLYAERSTAPYGGAALAGLEMTATDACTVAVALLRAQDLTPFDLSIWFSSSNVEGS